MYTHNLLVICTHLFLHFGLVKGIIRSLILRGRLLPNRPRIQFSRVLSVQLLFDCCFPKSKPRCNNRTRNKATPFRETPVAKPDDAGVQVPHSNIAMHKADTVI